MITEKLKRALQSYRSTLVKRFVLLRYSSNHDHFILGLDTQEALSPYITIPVDGDDFLVSMLQKVQPSIFSTCKKSNSFSDSLLEIIKNHKEAVFVPIRDGLSVYSVVIFYLDEPLNSLTKSEFGEFKNELSRIKYEIEKHKSDLQEVPSAFRWLDAFHSGLQEHLEHLEDFDDREDKKRLDVEVKIEAVIAFGVNKNTLIHALSLQFGLPYISNDALPPYSSKDNLKGYLRSNEASLFIDNSIKERIIIATSNPFNTTPLDFIDKYIPGRQYFCFTLPEDVKRYHSDSEFEKKHENLKELEQKVKAPIKEERRDDDNYVTGVVKKIIQDALREEASDIHIEPNIDKDATVRFRIDGECIDYRKARIPDYLTDNVIRFLKSESSIDTQDDGLPKDGKFGREIEGHKYNFRVATIPTHAGNSAVLRILKPQGIMDIGHLGLSVSNLKKISEAIQLRQGLFLVVGPTGSGKTVSLHSLLKKINTEEKKIWTAEDPVEITQSGLQQVQVDTKRGRTFDTVLKAFLRADPDVILVGEIRDKNTAETALRASLTGHLVLSTLHTNSAIKTITRIVDMGLDQMNFSDALIGILSQRLVKRLCECKEKLPVKSSEHEALSQLGIQTNKDSFYAAKGCGECGYKGYKGRLGIHEYLHGSVEVRNAIYDSRPISEIEKLAKKEGFVSLVHDAFEKAQQGFIDLKTVIDIGQN